MKNAPVVSAHLVLFAALAAHRQESSRLSTDYLRRATPPIHWPQGLEPRSVDVFVHNESWIDAPPGIVWANLIDATRRPGGHSNSPDALDRAFEISLGKLRLDYVDLYMTRWPSRDVDMAATLEALMELRERGLTRAIGVCNFNLLMIRRAVEEIGAPIACHQVEYHPFLAQDSMLAYLNSKAIPLTAYAPLAQGRAAKDATLATIGRKHGATAAQVAIAWLLDQQGVIAIPKAGWTESQKANLDALGISLDDEDRAAISALPKDQRFVRPPFAPEWDAVA